MGRVHVKLADESPLVHLYWETVGVRLASAAVGRRVTEKWEERRAEPPPPTRTVCNPQWEQLIR